MFQHEYVPHHYGLEETRSISSKNVDSDTSVVLKSLDSGPAARFTFEAIGPNLFRTTFSSSDHPLPPHPSVIKPTKDLKDVSPITASTNTQKRIELGDITAVVDWTDSPVISIFMDDEQKPIHRDLNFRSYALDSRGVAHYTAYKRHTLHVGLGEKAAPMNLSNRHFLLSATDCFGYDVYRTDPMYKHIPLLINVTPNGCAAIFSTSHSRGTWAVGSEVDGLWGHYKVYRQAYGGLEEYLIVGRTLTDILKTYASLVGYPKLVPRWAFGYVAGGMKYSMLDQPRACDAHLEFVEKLKEHDIPCSAFQMSSGYTVAETEPKTRNVFTWNSHRFPDPKGFAREMHAAGIRLISNVKPYVLANHPAYKQLADSGALFIDPRTKKTAIARLWSAGGGESGEGSHIDFTSSAGFQWWFKGCQALRGVGIDGIWNDNNEYTIPHDDWELALDNAAIQADLSQDHHRNDIGLWGRSMQTELMGKASHDALVGIDPKTRPYVLTRSATAGTMRYAASSWSGDNVTSWEGMKGANALSLNAGMSLLTSYGHDIGGFEGPQPSPELLLRWIQLGIYSPRFAINCFKTSPTNNLLGDVIEPWMYPEIIPQVRGAIKRRYEILPYLYSLALESTLHATPPQRWIGWGYEKDPEVWKPKLLKGEEQYWLGDALMVGGVYEEGLDSARVYLPVNSGTPNLPTLHLDSSALPTLAGSTPCEGYINLSSPYQHIPAGQWATISSPWTSSIPLLAKIGSAIPVGKSVPTTSVRSPIADPEDAEAHLEADDWRGVEIFPPKFDSNGKIWASSWYEDDGLASAEHTRIVKCTVTYSCTAEDISVGFAIQDLNGKSLPQGGEGQWMPLWNSLHVILPIGDERVVRGSDTIHSAPRDLGNDNQGRKIYVIDGVL